MMGMTAIHVRCDCHDGLSAKDTKAVPDSVGQGSAVLVGPGLRVLRAPDVCMYNVYE